MILNSDSAPDVMEYNKGNATAGLLSKQGLLTDLTPWRRKRRLGQDARARASRPPPSTTTKGIMGSGKWYGVPNYGEYVMVFYNKDMFAKYDVQVPTTLDEFDHGAGHVQDQGRHADLERRRRVSRAADLLPARAVQGRPQLGRRLRALQEPGRLPRPRSSPTRADTLSDWVKKGYIAQELRRPQGRGHGRGMGAGQVPDHDLGQLVVRPLRLRRSRTSSGARSCGPATSSTPAPSGNLWVVPAKAKNKTLADDFIKITMSKKIQNLHGQPRRHPGRGRPLGDHRPEEQGR